MQSVVVEIVHSVRETLAYVSITSSCSYSPPSVPGDIFSQDTLYPFYIAIIIPRTITCHRTKHSYAT